MAKKLAILAPLKSWGGIERTIVNLCREFVLQGVELEFIMSRGGQIPYPDELPSGVRIVDLRSSGKLDTVPRLIRHLRQNGPDALLTTKDHAAKVAVAARKLGRLNVPVFIKVTNTLSQTMRRPMKRHIARLLYPCADGVIANSQGVKDDLVTRFRMRADLVKVVYNPTFTRDIAQRVLLAADHPWLVPGEPPVVMGAGRLTPQKDFSCLVRAFAQLRRRRSCRLLILGEGPERPAIEMLARELGVAADVCLPGFIPDPIPWMARAGVFVLSSRYEGLSNVLIEALAAGAPVVSTDCPSGSSEILGGGKYGPLVSVGDASALSDAIDSVISSPRSPELIREAVSRFRSDLIARQYLEVMGLVEARP
jgi:glycosyltransferase involved in cell wall biosynthesis